MTQLQRSLWFAVNLLVPLGLAASIASAQPISRGPCLSLAFSSDGQRLLCGFEDAELRLQKADGGALLHQYTKPHARVRSVVVSPDGKLVASASEKTVEVWDARTGLLEHVFTKHSGCFFAVAFSADSRRLAGAGCCQLNENSPGTFVAMGVTSYQIVGDVRIWNLGNGKTTVLRATHDAHSNLIESVAFSPNGNTLAVAKGHVELWDAGSGEVLRTYPWYGTDVNNVGFSADGQTLVGGGWHTNQPHSSGEACVWDTASGETRLHFQPGNYWVRGSAISGDERLVATACGDGTAKIWSLPDGSLLRTLDIPDHGAYSVAFSPDASRLACSSLDGSVTQWSVEQGTLLQSSSAPPYPPGIQPWLAAHYTPGISSVAYAPDGSFMVSGGEDQAVRCWDTVTGKLRWCSDNHYLSIYGVAISQSGNTIASGSWDNLVRLWDVQSGKCLFTLTPGGDVDRVAFAPDVSVGAEPLVVTSSHHDKGGDEIKVWNSATGQLLHTLSGHTGWIQGLQFTPDGLVLVSASLDGTVKLWDPLNGTLMRTLKGAYAINCMAVSTDGRLLATGGYGGVEIWDLASGKVTANMPWAKGGLYGIGFSPDNELVIGGGFHEGHESGPEPVVIWDTKTGAQRGSLKAPTRWVHSLAVSPTDRVVAIGCDDGTVAVDNF